MAASTPKPRSRTADEILGGCKIVFADAREESQDLDALKARIETLYSEAIDQYHQGAFGFLTQARGIDVARRQLENYVTPKCCSLEFRVMGPRNQFDLVESGTSSACTNIVQYFLSQILEFSDVGMITPDFIDECVVQGTKNHQGWIDAQERSLGAQQQRTENLAHDETKDLYPLQNITVNKTVHKTQQDQEKSTLGCFSHLLYFLEQVMLAENEGAPIGVVLTAHGETYGLTLLREEATTIYVLFDSHGSKAATPRGPAYVISATDQKEMAKELSKLIEYKKNEIEDVSEEVKNWLEGEAKEQNALSVIPVRYRLVDEKGNVLPASWLRKQVAATTTTATTNLQTPQGTPTTRQSNKTPDPKETTSKINAFVIGLLCTIIALMVAFRTVLIQRITSFTTAHGIAFPPAFIQGNS